MPITLGTTPHSNWRTLAPLLQALGCAISDQTNPEHWYLAEEPRPESLFLLAYTRPEHALATAMEEGTAPGDALQRWAEHAQALVALFKSNRRQAVMIDATRAQQHPEQAAAALAGHWQLDFASVTDTKNASEPANPFYQLVATAAVQQNKSIKPLLAQLEACSLPLTEAELEADPSLDVDALYAGLQATWKELENAKQLEKDLQQTKGELKKASSSLQQTSVEHEKAHSSNVEESQLLLEQLHLVQEELEHHVRAGKDTEQTIAKLKKQLEKAKSQAKEAEEKSAQTAQAKTKAEREFKTGTADQQALLKKEQTAHTKTKAEKATLENQLKALKATNKDQAGQLENLTEENQLLLEQLHLVQEELENKFLQAQGQKQTLEAVQARLEQAETQLHQTESQHTASQKETALLQRRLQKLRTSMEALERSNRSLNGNLAEVKNQLAAARKHQANWELKCQQAEREGTLALAAANRKITELSTELNKVTSSRTWKLANPATAYSKKARKAAADKLEQQKAEIHNSGLFDESWYLEQYEDVAEAGLDAIEHYLKTGAYEGRNPSDHFDTTWYLSHYRDVTESGLNPLVHYIRFGRQEERAPRPGALVSLPAPEAGKSAEPK